MLGAIENWLVRLRNGRTDHKRQRGAENERTRHRPLPATARTPFARSGNALANPSRVAGSTPRSVMRPVTSRAGVTSKP